MAVQKWLRRIILTGLLFFLSWPFWRTLWGQRNYYFEPYNLERGKSLYEISQYVKGPGAAWIADEILFAYAGFKYVEGTSPILINPENPPLGKYLIGFSIKYLNTEKLPTLIFEFLALVSLFLLARVFLRSIFLSLLPVVFLARERVFYEQVQFMPLLDVFALVFLFWAIIFFVKAQDKRCFFLLSSVCLGLLWSTRPWMATVPLVISWAVYLWWQNKKSFVFWLASLPVALIPLVFSYANLLFSGESLYRILSVQKWILWYHQSRLINLGTVWPLIYGNRWYVWWGDQPYLQMVQWTVLWLIFVTLTLIFGTLTLLNRIKFKYNRRVLILILWVVFYLLFLSMGNVSSRYLLYLMPFCYIIGTYFLVKWLKLRYE